MALFREGDDEAFRTIHDRYRQRLFAYTRQMLPGARQDAEDALQDVFVRAYSGLRANDRELTLRAWLYRVAHNRCVDELRRPMPPAPEVLGILRAPSRDPVLEAEQRASLRQLVQDVRQLPEQQRSALLMRELGGIPYGDIAGALGTSVAAVKSLLVRARLGLAQAAEARDTACSAIREELILAHDRGVRPSGLARRHMHECTACREFRGEIRSVSRQFAALIAPIGPLGMIANLLGFGGSGGAAAASGGASAGAGAAGAGAAAAGGSAATAGAGFVAVGHVATLLAAAVVTAGGAMELQHSLSTPVGHTHHVRHVGTTPAASAAASPSAGARYSAPSGQTYPTVAAAARSASIASRPRTPSGNQAPRGTNLSSAVAQLTSAAENEVPTTGGNGVGAGDDGTTGDSTGTGSTTTDPGTTTSTAPTTTSGILPSGGDSSTDGGSTSSGTGDGSDSSATPPVTSTSDPNATSSSAGGGSGSPTASGSSATSTGSSAGGSSSGSDPNWPL